jgi:hypothetical protein
LSATNGLSRPPERPVVDTRTQAAVAAVKSGAVGDVSPRQPEGTETTVQGVGDKEILFGMAAPFSGASRELGRQMQIGVETAFSQINAAGGLNGRLLRLVAADDGYEPGKTADAMHLLYDKEKVFGFLGNVGTPTAAVSRPSPSTIGRCSSGRSLGPVFFAEIHPIATSSTIARAMPKRPRPWCIIW